MVMMVDNYLRLAQYHIFCNRIEPLDINNHRFLQSL